MKELLIIMTATFLLSACVAGQSIKFDYEAASIETSQQAESVAVQVSDQRPYIKEGDKRNSYIGHFRAGFGNTWDVHTAGDIPLAEQIAADLQKDLESLGFVKAATPGKQKTLTVEIHDWNFDAMTNGKFWYALKISVKDSSGNTLARQELKDKKIIKGSLMLGAKPAIKRELPELYNEIIKSIARDNQAILSSLKL